MPHDHHFDPHNAAHSDLARDPVCGMKVDPLNAKHRHTHQGTDYFFCCNGCKTKFIVDPNKYLAPKDDKAKAAAMPQGTIFTCPMHPEVRQEGPGACPICGMALEPETISLDDGPNPELSDMSRRFWLGRPKSPPPVLSS